MADLYIKSSLLPLCQGCLKLITLPGTSHNLQALVMTQWKVRKPALMVIYDLALTYGVVSCSIMNL